MIPTLIEDATSNIDEYNRIAGYYRVKFDYVTKSYRDVNELILHVWGLYHHMLACDNNEVQLLDIPPTIAEKPSQFYKLARKSHILPILFIFNNQIRAEEYMGVLIDETNDLKRLQAQSVEKAYRRLVDACKSSDIYVFISPEKVSYGRLYEGLWIYEGSINLEGVPSSVFDEVLRLNYGFNPHPLIRGLIYRNRLL